MGRVEYVLGRRRHGEVVVSRAWAQISDVIVDIAADQFAEIGPTVVVTQGDRLRGTFNCEVQHATDCSVYDDQTPGPNAIFAKILREAQSSAVQRAD